jgi:hypothetical protein
MTGYTLVKINSPKPRYFSHFRDHGPQMPHKTAEKIVVVCRNQTHQHPNGINAAKDYGERTNAKRGN